jgi:hypothetical protein
MSERWRQAVHYRNRAEMLRTIAEETDHGHHKAALRHVAEYYDTLAEKLERETRESTPPR